MRAWRVWAVLAVVLVVGALVVTSVTQGPGRPNDPTSAAPEGSRALARVLAQYGVAVQRTTALPHASDAALLVTDPDAYSAEQLRAMLTPGRRVVFVLPGLRSLQAVGSRAEPDANRTVRSTPQCEQRGALATGRLAVPGDAVAYDGLSGACYGGLVGSAGPVVVLGSAEVLQNRVLGDDGVAALAVNTLTADRSVRQLEWALPGPAAAGSGPASIWDLFPGGVYRAFAWLLLVGVLVVVWRARRLGGVVREPLPVVVRSAEVVEGHGRLYERAGARDRAAAALRAATLDHLRRRLALPRSASAQDVAARLGTHQAGVLEPSVPPDDAALLRLAQELDRLEEDVHGG